MTDSVRIACLGDVVGRPGREAIKSKAALLRQEMKIDLMIANGENSAGGIGIDVESANQLRSSGIDLITLGDHAWNKSEIRGYLDRNSEFIIRPANYPQGAPGKGFTVNEIRPGVKVGVFNLLGRVFVGQGLDCPFRMADQILEGPLASCSITICDFHAEATSEKYAMARYLDGRISLLYGTHTHVQTADSQILNRGTAYITDLGMCGSGLGVIGMDSSVAIARFTTGLPCSYKVANGDPQLNGVTVEFDAESGKALTIDRLSIHL